MPIDQPSEESAHHVAARRARLASQAIRRAEEADEDERIFLRAVAVLQSTAAYLAEVADRKDDRLHRALLEAVGEAAEPRPAREDLPDLSGLPETQRALTLAFAALKDEASRAKVDLSGVVQAAIISA